MLRIALCDDERFIHEQLNVALKEYAFLTTKPTAFTYTLAYFSSMDEFKLKWSEYDVLFLDIALGNGKSGIEEAIVLRQQGMCTPIVLLTSMIDKYKDGYDINAFQYIVKPISIEKFSQTMDALLISLTSKKLTIEIKYKGYSDFIRVDDILYIETYNRMRFVHTVTGKHQTLEPWESLINRLPTDSFYSPHRSFFVNFYHVVGVSKGEVKMSNGNNIR